MISERSKTFMICGGTSRAGLDVARILAARGAKCIVAGRNPPSDEDGGADKLSYEAVDFSKTASVDAFSKRISDTSYPAIDCCVFFQRSRSADLLEGMQVSIVSSTTIVATLHAKLASIQGSVIFIGSVVGEMVATDQTLAYHVCKGSVAPVVRYLAVQYGGRIRVNAIALSTLKHSRNEAGYGPGTFLDDVSRKVIPRGRPTTSADVADAIQFLSGEGASAITGEILNVDGGLNLLSQVSSALLSRS